MVQSGKAGYELSTLVLLCPMVTCDDGSLFYMRGEEEIFCANSDLQFSFQGDFFRLQLSVLVLKCNISGATAGHTTSAVFLSLKSPNVRFPESCLEPCVFPSHSSNDQSVLQHVLDGVGDAAMPGFIVTK